MKSIAVISTGGTIEKTYCELEGVLENRVNVLDVMLATLDLRGVTVKRVPLMNKDSLELTAADHDRIARTTHNLSQQHEGVVIVHGTDRLAGTGDRVYEKLGLPRVPVVLTGAMRPYQLRNTDALQNITEALLAVQVLPPGVFVVMQNKVLQFPGVEKDYETGTFMRPALPEDE